MALVAVVSLTLELVPGSAKPTLVRAEPTTAASPKESASRQSAKREKVQSAVKPKATRKRTSKPLPVRTPPASAPKRAAKQKARATVKVERMSSWRRYRGAVYYQVHLQRGAKTIYEARTLKRTASIRLKLRPGRYRAVVRPAIPSDTGIILGRVIMDRIVRV